MAVEPRLNGRAGLLAIEIFLIPFVFESPEDLCVGAPTSAMRN